MDSRDAAPKAAPKKEDQRVGMCSTCLWVRVVQSARGSAFYLCRRSEMEPQFARYPRLPVIQCAGFEPGHEAATK